jgi:hypothetical protein
VTSQLVCDLIRRTRSLAYNMRSFLYSSAGPPGSVLQAAVTVESQHPLTHSRYPAGCQLTPGTQHSDATTFNQQAFFDVNSSALALSSRARDHVTRAIRGAWADSTMKRYTGAIKQYIRFCDAERVPEHLRFPSDEFILCAFAASSFGKHAGGTPRSRLSALKAWHVAHNVEWKGSARLRYVLNGVHNSAPRSSRRPPRPPITADMLVQLVGNLDLNSPFDAAVAACAVTAFWGQCRLGELLPISSSISASSSLSSLPTRSDFKRSVRNPLSCLLRLPTTKTHHHGQDVVLVDQRAPINPISLLKSHLRVNSVRSDSHIFSYQSGNGLLPLSKGRFLQRCNSIWSRLGYPRTTGHCFRIGGTTELLIAGVSPDVVRTTGRWSSESFLRYWRSLDAIAPLHIRNIHTNRQRRRRRSRPPCVG